MGEGRVMSLSKQQSNDKIEIGVRASWANLKTLKGQHVVCGSHLHSIWNVTFEGSQ